MNKKDYKIYRLEKQIKDNEIIIKRITDYLEVLDEEKHKETTFVLRRILNG